MTGCNRISAGPSTCPFRSRGIPRIQSDLIEESINSGVPLITVALFGDQHKNSKIAAKHGFAVNIKKSTFNEETVAAAIKEVLENEK